MTTYEARLVVCTEDSLAWFRSGATRKRVRHEAAKTAERIGMSVHLIGGRNAVKLGEVRADGCWRLGETSPWRDSEDTGIE